LLQAPRYGRSGQRKLRRTRFEALEKERAAGCREEHAKRVERSDSRGILPWPSGEPRTVLGGRALDERDDAVDETPLRLYDLAVEVEAAPDQEELVSRWRRNIAALSWRDRRKLVAYDKGTIADIPYLTLSVG
jgi:hypothetical protein